MMYSESEKLYRLIGCLLDCFGRHAGVEITVSPELFDKLVYDYGSSDPFLDIGRVSRDGHLELYGFKFKKEGE